ncbi:hypothetical protein SERLADRAFT_431821 [Serpula lacrymans var. lacrymans S7.9]|uniref:DUF6532 domain-containing protein n=1 Tax=Serpula lacrymans var. lacrymans (strain S7.9) TaxID=578457 RepID=F8NDM9_SERL9|nr:uncharacterized protein SERLADRAFT_431821 [Serpula lacrymans var. lacrymans S7.9]EGO30313.1 hypothetical protein SERLADRAFT_431821 [Serpula lacrymans var. lacrymans S7.9]
MSSGESVLLTDLPDLSPNSSPGNSDTKNKNDFPPTSDFEMPCDNRAEELTKSLYFMLPDKDDLTPDNVQKAFKIQTAKIEKLPCKLQFSAWNIKLSSGMMGLHQNILNASRTNLMKVDKEVSVLKGFMDENGMSYADPDNNPHAGISPGSLYGDNGWSSDGIPDNYNPDTIPSDKYNLEYQDEKDAMDGGLWSLCQTASSLFTLSLAFLYECRMPSTLMELKGLANPRKEKKKQPLKPKKGSNLNAAGLSLAPQLDSSADRPLLPPHYQPNSVSTEKIEQMLQISGPQPSTFNQQMGPPSPVSHPPVSQQSYNQYNHSQSLDNFFSQSFFEEDNFAPVSVNTLTSQTASTSCIVTPAPSSLAPPCSEQPSPITFAHTVPIAAWPELPGGNAYLRPGEDPSCEDNISSGVIREPSLAFAPTLTPPAATVACDPTPSSQPVPAMAPNPHSPNKKFILTENVLPTASEKVATAKMFLGKVARNNGVTGTFSIPKDAADSVGPLKLTSTFGLILVAGLIPNLVWATLYKRKEMMGHVLVDDIQRLDKKLDIIICLAATAIYAAQVEHQTGTYNEQFFMASVYRPFYLKYLADMKKICGDDALSTQFDEYVELIVERGLSL